MWGQVSSGTLVGDITDEKSLPAAEVTVTARNEETGFERVATTNALGSYRIDELQPGSYTITAGKAGFRTTSIPAVSVLLNQKNRLDFELRLGAQHDAINVTGQASPLQTDEASSGYSMGSEFVRDLPLASRNVISLVTLGPGAIPRQLGGFVPRHHQRPAAGPGRGGAQSAGQRRALDSERLRGRWRL